MCGLFNLLHASIFIMTGVLYITLELQLSVFNKGVKRKCMNHGGFLWVYKGQFLVPIEDGGTAKAQS